MKHECGGIVTEPASGMSGKVIEANTRREFIGHSSLLSIPYFSNWNRFLIIDFGNGLIKELHEDGVTGQRECEGTMAHYEISDVANPHHRQINLSMTV